MAKKPSSRRGERALAFQFLYGLAFTPVHSEAELERSFKQSPPIIDKDAEACAFAWELVNGVWHKYAEIDEIIAGFARNWRLDRMGRVELTLLRLAVYELYYKADIPPRVTINEALELLRNFGDESARSFINGILDAAARALNKDVKAPGPNPAP